MSNKAAFLESEKGHFAVSNADIGKPGEREVLVKVCERPIKF
jgi:Zn-dependent alcohol dehydrogenase